MIKSLFKIFLRYIVTAASITIIVFMINLIVFTSFTYYYAQKNSLYSNSTEQLDLISQSLTQTDTGYVMLEDGLQLIEPHYSWAMLLDDTGRVVWDWQRPSDIKDSYTIAEIASFSRWYLNDYPVTVWQHGGGILVLASSKDKVMKLSLNYSIPLINRFPEIILGIVFLNLALILLIATFFGFRFYRALQPIALGIEGLANNEKIILAEKGMAADLAKSLNRSSKRLEIQNHQLARRDNARTEWISGVSHDIRTPLSMIMGYADGLESDASLTSVQQKKASIIKKQSLVIKKLIEDLNLTSKLEYNMQPLRISSYFPAALLREIITSYYNAGLPDCCQIDLLIEPDAELLTLSGDTGLLTRAFQNLIGNSLKHNHDNCCITVKAFLSEDDLHIHFSDNGMGIPASVVKTLLYDNLPAEQKPHIMGLRVVRSILAAHDGQLIFIPKDTEDYYETDVILPNNFHNTRP